MCRRETLINQRLPNRHERGGRRLLLGGLFALGLVATPVAAGEVVTEVIIDGQVIHFELEDGERLGRRRHRPAARLRPP